MSLRVVMSLRVMVVVAVFMFVDGVVMWCIDGVVGVTVKRPLEEEHQEKPDERPTGGGLDVVAKGQARVRQEMEQPHPEQDAAGQGEQHLHRPMPE